MRLCACGCGTEIFKGPSRPFAVGHKPKQKRSDYIPPPLCACGCGQRVAKRPARFAKGHIRGNGGATRGRPSPKRKERALCACGCGQRVVNLRSQWAKGHYMNVHAKAIAAARNDPKGAQSHSWRGGISYRGAINSTGTRYLCARTLDDDYEYIHRAQAEAALGRALADNELVFRGVPWGPVETGNLVIGGSWGYAKLIQRRARALLECGDPSKRWCTYCGTWDDPAGMHMRPEGPSRSEDYHHRVCANMYAAIRAGREQPRERGESFHRRAIERAREIAEERARNAERKRDRPIAGKLGYRARQPTSDGITAAYRRTHAP